MGCKDALFLLRTVLQDRREHNLETHVLFVDLVKAFDTVNHDLLFCILRKYGIPDTLISVIQSLHNDLKVNLKLSKKLQLEIDYTNGVKQGDNMAPVLFLYIIQAMTETLTPILEENNVFPISLLHYPKAENNKIQHGMLAGQKTGTRATQEKLSITAILFADDGAFPFKSRLDMVIGANLLFKHLKRFGLQMHVGTESKPSKTEAMFFPASKPSVEEIENTGRSSETFSFPVSDGFVTYCKSFKYLGSIITPCLSDNLEVSTRIRRATGQLGQLISIFRSPNVPLSSKKLLYLQIPLNTVLWGCESWTLTADIIRKLQVFQNNSLRRILNINMYDVMNDKIENGQLLRAMNNLQDIIDTIRERQLNWLGKLVKRDNTNVPLKALAAWSNNPRKQGKPPLNARKTYITTIQLLIPDTPKNRTLKHWIPTAINKDKWNLLISKWKKSQLDSLIERHKKPKLYNNRKSLSRKPRELTQKNDAITIANLQQNNDFPSPWNEDPELALKLGYLPSITEEN
jgi:hypothetical protein